ncbi:MAG: hypothetical protein V8S24_12570 [Gordonibacter pamelaeae]
MDFGTFQLLVNLVILVAVFAFDKWQIGLGTIINMVFVGYLIELFTWMYRLLPWQPSGLVSAGVHLVLGTLLFTLGVSLYLKTRMGVAPIDAIAPVIVARTRFSYTPVRMAQDILVTVVAVLRRRAHRRVHRGGGVHDRAADHGVEPRGHASALPPLPRAGPGRAGRGARLAAREERRRAMQRAGRSGVCSWGPTPRTPRARASTCSRSTRTSAVCMW